MRRKSIITARVIWMLYLLLGIAGAVLQLGTTFSADPWHVTCQACIVVGALCIWSMKPVCQVAAGSVGVIFTLIVGWQFLEIMNFFSHLGSISHVTFRVGPLKLEGLAGVAAVTVPLVLLFLASCILLWHAAEELQGNGPQERNPES